MQMQARILVGSLREATTRKGEKLPKCSLRVLDLGIECGSDVTTYWIDFLGDAALNQDELDSVMGGEFTIDIRSVRSSLGKNGKAYLNMSGGAVTNADGLVLQPGLRNHHQKLAS